MTKLTENNPHGTANIANDRVLATVFSKCKEGTIVAFKDIEKQIWFTGYIQTIFEPNGKYNKTDKYSISIVINIPIEPQWYDDNKTVYFYDDICAVVILENG